MTYLRTLDAAGAIPVVLPPRRHGSPAAAARPARRHLCCPAARTSTRPPTARPSATPSSARPSRASTPSSSPRPRWRCTRGMPILGDLPRRAGAQRRLRRHAAPARRRAIARPRPATRGRRTRSRSTRARACTASSRTRTLAVNSFHHQAVDELGDGPAGRRARRRTARSRRSRATGSSRSACSGTRRRWYAAHAAVRGRWLAAACPYRTARRRVTPWGGCPPSRLRGVVKRFGDHHRRRRPRPRGPRGHVRRPARPQRRGQVDDDAAAHRAGDRRRGRDRGPRPTRCPRESKEARARVRRRAAARQPRRDADRRAEPARLRPPLPGRRARAPGRRSSARWRSPTSPTAATRRSTSSPAACAGGC